MEIEMTRELIIEVYLTNPPKVVAEMLYDTITKYEEQLRVGQDNYDKLWDIYSELKKENKELKALLNTDIDTANVWTWKKKENK